MNTNERNKLNARTAVMGGRARAAKFHQLEEFALHIFFENCYGDSAPEKNFIFMNGKATSTWIAIQVLSEAKKRGIKMSETSAHKTIGRWLTSVGVRWEPEVRYHWDEPCAVKTGDGTQQEEKKGAQNPMYFEINSGR